MTKYYAGIGSRDTPKEVLEVMTALGSYLQSKGYVLRSGGAKGADSAFEAKVTNKEIFLIGDNYANIDKAMQIAKSNHPAWDKCSDYAKDAHARNTFQILGLNHDKPVDFVLCWTPDAKVVGGTGTALRLAQSKGISIINLAEGIQVSKVRLSRLIGRKLVEYGKPNAETGIPRMSLPKLKEYLRADIKLYEKLQLELVNCTIDDVYLAMVLNEGLTYKTNIHYQKCDVYCGRGSPFGNRNKVENGNAIEKFQEDFNKAIVNPEVQKRVLKLKGQRLGCFCNPRACHCDVIINWLDNREQDLPL